MHAGHLVCLNRRKSPHWNAAVPLSSPSWRAGLSRPPVEAHCTWPPCLRRNPQIRKPCWRDAVFSLAWMNVRFSIYVKIFMPSLLDFNHMLNSFLSFLQIGQARLLPPVTVALRRPPHHCHQQRRCQYHRRCRHRRRHHHRHHRHQHLQNRQMLIILLPRHHRSAYCRACRFRKSRRPCHSQHLYR